MDVSGSVHVSVHSRVHVHVFMFSIGPVAECREAYTLNQPAGLLSHRLSSITELYSYSKFRLSRSVWLGTNTMHLTSTSVSHDFFTLEMLSHRLQTTLNKSGLCCSSETPHINVKPKLAALFQQYWLYRLIKGCVTNQRRSCV